MSRADRTAEPYPACRCTRLLWFYGYKITSCNGCTDHRGLLEHGILQTLILTRSSRSLQSPYIPLQRLPIRPRATVEHQPSVRTCSPAHIYYTLKQCCLLWNEPQPEPIRIPLNCCEPSLSSIHSSPASASASLIWKEVMSKPASRILFSSAVMAAWIWSGVPNNCRK